MLLLYKNQIRWRRIQNRAKHLKWRFLQKQLTALDVWQGFEYAFVRQRLKRIDKTFAKLILIILQFLL